MLCNRIIKVGLMFAMREMRALRQMDSLPELFVVHEGEEVCFCTVWFSNVRECDSNTPLTRQDDDASCFREENHNVSVPANIS